MCGVLNVVFDQTTQHNNVTVVGQHLGFYFAFVGNDVRGCENLRGNTRNFLNNIENHRITFIHLWCHLERNTHALSLNGLKWILCAVPNAGVCVGPCNERHLLTNGDKRFLVIQCQQARRGEDVSVALRLQRVENDSHRQGLVDHTPTQRGARNLCQGARNCSRPNIFRAVVRHDGIRDRAITRLLGRTGADVTAI